MPQDTLSEVLRNVRLRGALFYHVSCGPDWAAEIPRACDIKEAVIPGAEHVIEYHLVAKGEGWAAVLGQPPVRVHVGDVVMFPQGDAHVMSSAPGLRAERLEVDWVFRTRNHPKPIGMYAGMAPGNKVDGADTTLVCGFLGCDLRPFNPLIATLPRMLVIKANGRSDWIMRTILQAVEESASQRPGSEAVLERMSEMMFVDAVRYHLDSLPDGSVGWLAGLRDRFVGKALTLLHTRPAEPWTIEGLAEAVGLSRSALHERFVSLVGQPPIQYLTNWRMQLSARLLRETQAPVASIALDVGYDSEAAFTRAFKRIVGEPPARWRRLQASAARAGQS
jgi:AraC-like DNA-binding protein